MTITQDDVAEAAGVSATTVNFVLNGRWKEMKISEKSAQKVREAADKLGYNHNYHGRSLALGRSSTLGMMIMTGEVTNFDLRLTSGAVKEARKRGYDLLLLSPESGGDWTEPAFSALAQRRIDALIIPYFPGKSIPDEYSRHWPVVLPVQPPANGYPGVQLNPEPGMRAAVQHLADLGHRRLLYLGLCREGRLFQPDRWKALLAAAQSLGLDAGRIDVETPQTGLNPGVEERTPYLTDALERLLPQDFETTAVLCHNDVMGLALNAVLARRGLRVPRDVSIIGFDDFYASSAVPAMTTVSHMLPEIGAQAVSLAIRIIEEKHEYPCEMGATVDAELVIRESTAPPK